jgi:predicted aldo/keto reductase-like oxidoreductase
MEPVKGGSLVNLPDEAKAVFDSLNGGSYASYAIRFAAGFEGIFMTLSGMGNMDMMNDNISYMKDFKPLSEEERKAVDRVCEIFRAQDLVACTACRYCVDGCPKNIPIPGIFACMNAKKTFGGGAFYYRLHTENAGKASDCIKCGKCENACPQHLPIRALLKEAATMFEA